MTTPTRPSLDDPSLTIPVDHAGIFESIPEARTERQREFLALRDGEMLLNMGPHHPATHGVLRVVLKISGEQVVDLDPVLGYLHRGVEKLCENADYHQSIAYMDPLDYLASIFCEWPAVTAFEKLLDVEVPRRAEYLRVIVGELNRISSHTLYLGFMALDLGGITPILWSFSERDEIVEMLAGLTGARMLFNYFRIGGVNGDLNHEFMSRLGDWMSRAGAQLEAGMGLLNENEIFVRRARGLGILDRETALRMCTPGRTSGRPASRSTSAVPIRTASTRSWSSRSRLAARETRWRATCCGWTRSGKASESSTSASTRCPTGPSWRPCHVSCARARAAPTVRSRGRAASTPATR